MIANSKLHCIMKFSYKLHKVETNCRIHFGQPKNFSTGLQLRSDISNNLLTVDRTIRYINKGGMAMIIINEQTAGQLSLFSEQNILVEYISKCAYLRLDSPETDVMLLVKTGTKDEDLAKKRVISEAQLEVIKKSIFDKLGVNSFFQANFLIENS